MSIIWNNAEQGTEEWLEARRGAITGSKAKVARERKKNGERTDASLRYAMDLAREREGGTAPAVFQNAAMRTGTEQEPIARMKYEARTGELVDEVGFAHTEDCKFGLSLDGSIAPAGAIEIKTMVSSDTLFSALVDGDISEYRDQCLMAMWLLTLDYVDVVLWCPDLDLLRVIRVERDEDEIERFEADMLEFDRLVESYRARLRAVRGYRSDPPDESPAPPPQAADHAPAAPTTAPAPTPVVAVEPGAIPELF